MTQATAMKARFPSQCGGCSQPIPKGADIAPAQVATGRYGRLTTAYMHPHCASVHQNRCNEEAGEWFY